MRFTVGGEQYDLTKARVVAAMRGVPSEPVQKHVAEIDGNAFPPKQVFATVTGRERTSFTTMEAQRVLRRLGFVCRRASQPDHGNAGRLATRDDNGPSSVEDTLKSIEATLATLEAAVAGLHRRVEDLETAQ